MFIVLSSHTCICLEMNDQLLHEVVILLHVVYLREKLANNYDFLLFSSD